MAAEPSTTTAVGSLLNGTYLLERVIAEGGMGVVYEASHLRLPRRFAVKVLSRPKEGTLDANTALARFRREAEIASTLAHPHIVEVFDFQVSEAGSPYLVMELLEGEDLADRLKRNGRMPVTAALRVIEEIAQALDVAHTAGVVHRDLKPANIFLSKRAGRDDFVKVLDFGVSKLIDSATLTQEKAMVGTPLYMSPEQAVGTQELTPESDVFSLGAITYEMLTGRRAFAASSIPSILYQIVHGPTPQLQGKAPGLGPEVDEVFEKVLAKRKQDRFACSSAFALALQRALERPDSSAVPTSYLSEHEPLHLDERLRRAPSGAGMTGAAQTDVDQSTHAEEAMPDVAMPGVASSGVTVPLPNTSSVVLVPRVRRWPWGLAAALLAIAGGAYGWLRWGGAIPPAASGPSAAAVARPAPEPQTGPQTRPQTIVQKDSQMKPQNDPQTNVQNSPQTNVQNSPQTNVQNSPQNSPQTSLPNGPQTNLQNGPQTKLASGAQKQPRAEAQNQPLAEAQNQPQAEAQNEAPAEAAPAPSDAKSRGKKGDVQFIFHVVPRTAQITVDERAIRGQQVTLPWQNRPRRVRVVAPGYHPLSLTAPSTASRTFELRMERLHTPQPKPAAHPHPVHDAAPVQEL